MSQRNLEGKNILSKKDYFIEQFQIYSNIEGRHERIWGFPGSSVVKNLPAGARDLSSISRSGRSPGEGNGNPFRYSCLENPMDRGAWGLQSVGSQRVRHNTHACDAIHPSLLNHTENFHSSKNPLGFACLSLLPSAPHQTRSFITSIILAFSECHILGIILYAGFSDCLLSPRNMHLRFPCVFSGLGSSFLFRTA